MKSHVYSIKLKTNDRIQITEKLIQYKIITQYEEEDFGTEGWNWSFEIAKFAQEKQVKEAGTTNTPKTLKNIQNIETDYT